MHQMVTFCLLVLPLPLTVRKKLFTFLSENELVAKVSRISTITTALHPPTNLDNPIIACLRIENILHVGALLHVSANESLILLLGHRFVAILFIGAYYFRLGFTIHALAQLSRLDLFLRQTHYSECCV